MRIIIKNIESNEVKKLEEELNYKFEDSTSIVSDFDFDSEELLKFVNSNFKNWKCDISNNSLSTYLTDSFCLCGDPFGQISSIDDVTNIIENKLYEIDKISTLGITKPFGKVWDVIELKVLQKIKENQFNSVEQLKVYLKELCSEIYENYESDIEIIGYPNY